MPDYKNAFNCVECPESNTRSGCPAWVEYAQKNLQTGEERIKRGCLGQELIPLLVEVVAAANRAPAEVSAARSEIVGCFQQLISVAQTAQQNQLPGE